MNVLVVGNILKDVYLNLDTGAEHLETDKHGTKWLDLSFDASQHHFSSRSSSLGGAAVSLEVLQNLGLNASISGSSLNFQNDALTTNAEHTHRYILIADDKVTYFAPSSFATSVFKAPDQPIDFIYLDRSANLTAKSIADLVSFLDSHQNTKLVAYAHDFLNPHFNRLLSRVDLLFSEVPDAPELSDFDQSKLILISDTQLSYQKITEPISVERIDILTHLSLYSIASATVFGCFILGYSVEDSLKYARLNVENSRLNSTLSLSRLQDIDSNSHQNPSNNLELIAANLVLYPKGILAADESGGSIQKKFANLQIPDTHETRRDYRNLFFTTPGLDQYVNGIILFDETARQSADNGQNFVDYLTGKRIIPGIKVDQGLVKFPDSEETYTKGLDGLASRLKEYYQMGLRFTKWRAAFEIRLDPDSQIATPTDHAITENCRILAEYAKTAQDAGFVPIVEPEIVYDGNYDIDQSASTTAKILDQLFQTLSTHHVNLHACILKCNMVLAGKQFSTPSNPNQIGAKTAEVLKNHVPAELAGVVFLSGGQTPEQATDNLSAIIKNGPYPWPVTFSFARALQDPALYAWAGDNHNADSAREAFLTRLIANTDALKPQDQSTN